MIKNQRFFPAHFLAWSFVGENDTECNEILKEDSPFFGFSKLFDQTCKLSKTQHVKFASQKEPFQEHMSVGVRFLDDLLHLESVVFLTTKKLPWGATVPPNLPFWTARLFLRLNSFKFKPIFTQKQLTHVKLISKNNKSFHWGRLGGRSLISSNKQIRNKVGNFKFLKTRRVNYG